jgi:dTDP-4-amino-4,6-dideoxygalactose transaminase
MRIAQEEEEAVLAVLSRKRLFRYYGPDSGPSVVAELEQAFAEHMGSRYALAVASGTTALTAALAALGVGPGDEVIVPAYTWISSAAAVVAMGAVPILAEVDDSLTLDPADTEAKVTPYTRAIIAVHMRGAPADVAALQAVAERHNVRLLEDTAQADGGSFQAKRLGTMGDIGTFSLQFNKILTCGEGGMVLTDDQALYERAVMYHDVAAAHRMEIPVSDVFTGITCRMSELQGAVALVQLRRLDGMLQAMRARKAAIKERISEVAASRDIRFRRLNDAEGDTAITIIFYLPDGEQADFVARALSAEGVEAEVMFHPDVPDYHIYYHWTPILERHWWSERTPWDLHRRPVTYAQDMCPRTLDLVRRAVQIDVSPELSDTNVEEVAAALNKVFAALP